MVQKLFKKQKAIYLLLVICGVPQGSIVGHLLFLNYINDLQFLSDVLDPIILADDTNLHYSHKDINALFLKVNNKLYRINQWFIFNKLSINIKQQQNIHFSISKVSRMISPFYFLN